MSDVSQHARFTLVLADMAMADAQGKVNIIGGGLGVLGFDTATSLTSRFSVVAQVDVPAALTPVEATFEVVLLRDDVPVDLPGPAGPQVVRVGQATTFEKPQGPVPLSARERLSSRQQVVLDFASGLPLMPGAVYEWMVHVDGDEERGTRLPFSVASGPAAPVIG